jgi:hypothetical protein
MIGAGVADDLYSSRSDQFRVRGPREDPRAGAEAATRKSQEEQPALSKAPHHVIILRYARHRSGPSRAISHVVHMDDGVRRARAQHRSA